MKRKAIFASNIQIGKKESKSARAFTVSRKYPNCNAGGIIMNEKI
jgi:hypothetical protein